MLIILSRNEVSELFAAIIATVDTDNPNPLESTEVRKQLIKRLKNWESYPEVAEIVNQSDMLKHLLWFPLHDIQFNGLGEMTCRIVLDRFDTNPS